MRPSARSIAFVLAVAYVALTSTVPICEGICQRHAASTHEASTPKAGNHPHAHNCRDGTGVHSLQLGADRGCTGHGGNFDAVRPRSSSWDPTVTMSFGAAGVAATFFAARAAEEPAGGGNSPPDVSFAPSSRFAILRI